MAKDIVKVEFVPDPPIGSWRQITHTLPDRSDCDGWIKHLQKQKQSDIDVREIKYYDGKNAIGYQVWAKRRK